MPPSCPGVVAAIPGIVAGFCPIAPFTAPLAPPVAVALAFAVVMFVPPIPGRAGRAGGAGKAGNAAGVFVRERLVTRREGMVMGGGVGAGGFVGAGGGAAWANCQLAASASGSARKPAAASSRTHKRTRRLAFILFSVRRRRAVYSATPSWPAPFSPVLCRPAREQS